jgi:hypothetical protein
MQLQNLKYNKCTSYYVYFMKKWKKIRHKVRLLPFVSESFVFQFAIQKYKSYNIRTNDCACCFVWVRNVVRRIYWVS